MDQGNGGGAAAADQNVVPDILFTTAPVALVRLDGEPDLQAIPGSDVLVAVNSTATLLRLGVNGAWYMPVGGRWLTAAALAGPWQATTAVPEAVAQALAADLPEELRGIGIRIEDDAVVTARGCEILTGDVPKRATDIEALMAEGREAAGARRKRRTAS